MGILAAVGFTAIALAEGLLEVAGRGTQHTYVLLPVALFSLGAAMLSVPVTTLALLDASPGITASRVLSMSIGLQDVLAVAAVSVSGRIITDRLDRNPQALTHLQAGRSLQSFLALQQIAEERVLVDVVHGILPAVVLVALVGGCAGLALRGRIPL